MDISRLSFNQITADHYTLEEVIDACLQAGIPSIAPWRHRVAEVGIAKSAQMIKQAGLQVSSLCRGGMFPAGTKAERLKRINDNKRAIDEASELGSDVLVLVCGPSPDRNIDEARKMVTQGIETLIPYAEERNVKLGIEPLHPMFAGDRSVITTLGEANDMVEQLQSKQVGVIIDVYHVWWDPRLYEEIARSKGHILGFHVNDWITLRDVLTSRGMPGDGVIDISRIQQAVQQAGYHGLIEVEILNDKLWEQPIGNVMEQVKARFEEFV